MKHFLSLFFSVATVAFASAQTPKIFHTAHEAIRILHDGRPQQHWWVVSPEVAVDTLQSSARSVTLISTVDTLTVSGLRDWEHSDVAIVTPKGDTALTRVVKIPEVLYDNPPAKMRLCPGQKTLTREQATFDLDAMMYALLEIHPDIFSVTGQELLLSAFEQAKSELPDSLTIAELYKRAAPIVSLIGDGHTMVRFPYNSFFTADLKRVPMAFFISSDGSIIAERTIDNAIPSGAIVKAINGVADTTMINTMLPFLSGETRAFRLSRMNPDFYTLFELLYGGKEEYAVEYVLPEKSSKKSQTVVLPASDFMTIKSRIPAKTQNKPVAPYSYTIDKKKGVAIMDFNECSGAKSIKQLCDSMFNDLREQGIKKLVIDVRENGGGDSGVGDILLSYVVKKPFTQFDKVLYKVTPTTARLIGSTDGLPHIGFSKKDISRRIQPRTDSEGHFDGETVMLISNNTFSSGASFAWAFKEAGGGKTVGEETGGMNVCYGDIVMWKMPVSGIPVSISWKRFWQMDADENDVHGVLPDIAVPASKALPSAMKLFNHK